MTSCAVPLSRGEPAVCQADRRENEEIARTEGVREFCSRRAVEHTDTPRVARAAQRATNRNLQEATRAKSSRETQASARAAMSASRVRCAPAVQAKEAASKLAKAEAGRQLPNLCLSHWSHLLLARQTCPPRSSRKTLCRPLRYASLQLRATHPHPPSLRTFDFDVTEGALNQLEPKSFFGLF